MSGPYKENSSGVFDDDPAHTARKVANSLFAKGVPLDKIAKACGRKQAEVREWYDDWYAKTHSR